MHMLIVDDEPVARKVLREELELLEPSGVIEEAENGSVALTKIASTHPDLVFLDIQMPAMSGFEVIEHLNGGHLPAVVMVTAYDQYAIRAFEAGAIDYLLKPIGQQRLIQAIEKAKKMILSPVKTAENIVKLQEISSGLPTGSPKLRKVVGKIGEEFFLLNFNEVLAFQADGDIVWIFTAKQKYMATQTLRAIEERLAYSFFRRIHRNALVNIEQIRKLSMLSSQRWLITLNDGQEFVVSKLQAKNVRSVLRW
jgi:two-component system LytT family response regulator